MAYVTQRNVQGKEKDEAGNPISGDIYAIPITKAGKGKVVELNTADLPADSFLEIVSLGLKTFLNKGMGDVKTKDLEGDALAKAQAEAMKFGLDNLAKLMSGEFKKSKVAKIAGKVMTEAKRLARNWVKDQLKAAGEKVSHYDAKEITKAATAIVESEPQWVKMAEESLAQAAAQKTAVDIKGLIKVNPKLVEKAEAKKKGTGKKPLSATQAGILQPRARPQGGIGQRPTAH